MEALERYLEMWCGSKHQVFRPSNAFILHPFILGGYRYATDGIAIARVPAFTSPQTPDIKHDIAGIWRDKWREPAHPLPAHSGEVKRDYEMCECAEPCTHCVDVDPGCEKCNDGIIGKKDCPRCKGKGGYMEATLVDQQIGEAWYSGVYIRKLQQMPGPIMISKPIRPMDCLSWRSPVVRYIRGVIAPKRKRTSNTRDVPRSEACNERRGSRRMGESQAT
jgi:hypothetical protein